MATFNEVTIQQNNIIISLLKMIAEESLGDEGAFTEEFEEKINKVQKAADDWLNPTLE